ncbi:uncharacterized protein Bfra_011739 [Botrytis fragariae]|uniref:Uncharacterized protein n=1 Tax=Botrytis fragariae TaxID=1964551 RepID=A0A8H6AKV8_9HELO|nr:uncharacterized protein Bfra_011739 [Botrytis fragariae]KAF5869196.1 hypothetical protein Bfra_011739 [Botrytis fragariae]
MANVLWTENSDKENANNDEYGVDLPPRYSILQANIGENSSPKNKVWNGMIALPTIYNDDSSSVETVLDPQGLQRGHDAQRDDKQNPDKQENVSTDGSLSPLLGYSIELSHHLTTCNRDQSDSGYSDFEELENGSLLYFLPQQQGDMTQGCREQQNIFETGIERGDNTEPRKWRKLISLPINHTLFQRDNICHHL